MTDRDTEQRLYAEQLAAVARSLALPAEHAARAARVEQEAETGLHAALAAERTVKDRAASLERSMADLTGRVARLSARAGALPTPVSPGTPAPADLAQVEAETARIAADLRSAESAWSWVERATQAAAQPAPAPARAPIGVPAAPDLAQQPETAAKSSGCLALVAFFLWNAVALALLALILS